MKSSGTVSPFDLGSKLQNHDVAKQKKHTVILIYFEVQLMKIASSFDKTWYQNWPKSSFNKGCWVTCQPYHRCNQTIESNLRCRSPGFFSYDSVSADEVSRARQTFKLVISISTTKCLSWRNCVKTRTVFPFKYGSMFWCSGQWWKKRSSLWCAPREAEGTEKKAACYSSHRSHRQTSPHGTGSYRKVLGNNEQTSFSPNFPGEL